MGWRVAGPVTVIAIVAVVLVGTAVPCLACSCASRPLGRQVEEADAVFVGRVSGDRLAPGGTFQVFDVEGVFKGEERIGERVDLFAEIGPGVVDTCAVLFAPGDRVAVIASANGDGSYSTSICTRASPEGLVERLGQPLPPDPQIPYVPATSRPAGADDGRLPGWQVAALGALGGILLITVASFLGARRERRRLEEGTDELDHDAGDVVEDGGEDGGEVVGSPESPS